MQRRIGWSASDVQRYPDVAQQLSAFEFGDLVLVDDMYPLNPATLSEPSAIFRKGVNVSNVFQVLSVSIEARVDDYEARYPRVGLEISNQWILGAHGRLIQRVSTDVYPLPSWMDPNSVDSPTVWTTYFNPEGEHVSLCAGVIRRGTFWVDVARGEEVVEVESAGLIGSPQDD